MTDAETEALIEKMALAISGSGVTTPASLRKARAGVKVYESYEDYIND